MKVRVLSLEEIETIAREAERTKNEPLWQLANEVHGARKRVRGGEIVAESILSAQDGRGRVRVTWHEEEAFLDLEIAIGLGQSIIEAACAARIDAAFYAHASGAGVPLDVIAAIMQRIRGARRVDDARRPS